jgi:hypothetical protein
MLESATNASNCFPPALPFNAQLTILVPPPPPVPMSHVLALLALSQPGCGTRAATPPPLVSGKPGGGPTQLRGDPRCGGGKKNGHGRRGGGGKCK